MTNTPIRVGILGATGYTASESIRLLLTHPQAIVTTVTSRHDAGRAIGSIHPQFLGRLDLPISEFDPSLIADQCDIVFSCLPHGASAETVRAVREAGPRVIDFSADFRLGSVDEYERCYGVTHPWPERIGKVPYGIPEFYREAIAAAEIVANPGCYPTSVILPLTPLLKAGLIADNDIIVDAKSGVSGAGRSPKLNTLYCEANESIAAYAVGAHRHQPEMVDLLGRASEQRCELLFTPHLTPMNRGILSTIYVRPNGANISAVMEAWNDAFHAEPFVHPTEDLPSTKSVAGTNHVQMTVRQAGDRLVILCAIDNLVKGAAGAAVQNMNCMFGLDEQRGLSH